MTNETGCHEEGAALTAREREVCALVCSGLTNKEAAIKLQVSARTIEDHRLHAMKKFGARNIAQLVLAFHGIKQEAGL